MRLHPEFRKVAAYSLSGLGHVPGNHLPHPVLTSEQCKSVSRLQRDLSIGLNAHLSRRFHENDIQVVILLKISHRPAHEEQPGLDREVNG